MRFGERVRVGVPVRSWTRKTGDAPWGIAVLATGGSSNTITDGSSYTLLSYTGDGTFTVTSAGIFECLLVAGGGAAGNNLGNNEPTGGGGGGSALITRLFLPAGTYTAKVGAGAAANTGQEPQNRAGGASAIYNSASAPTFYAIAEGGQGGGSAWGASVAGPMNIGGNSYRDGYGNLTAIASTSPICFNGGQGTVGADAGGGAGAGGSASNQTAGVGRSSTFTGGAAVTYGSGGSGGQNNGTHGVTGSAIGGGGGGRGRSTVQNGPAGNGGAVYIRFGAN